MTVPRIPPKDEPNRPASAEGSDADRRLHRRHEVDWPAICALASGFSWTAKVVDAGRGGLGLENCPALREGQIVTVTLADIGTFCCRVAWSRNARCGIEFMPIDGERDEESLTAMAAILAST